MLPVAAPLVEFAEEAPANARNTALALGAAAAPVVADWVRELRALVEAHDDPQALQDALLQAYSELPTSDLTEVMALAFELAHLQGRDQAAREAGHG